MLFNYFGSVYMRQVILKHLLKKVTKSEESRIFVETRGLIELRHITLSLELYSNLFKRAHKKGMKKALAPSPPELLANAREGRGF